MKNQEIRELGNKELADLYKSERKRLMKMEFSHAVSQIEQPHQLKETRKNIARMLTELNNRRKQAEANALLKQLNEENNGN